MQDGDSKFVEILLDFNVFNTASDVMVGLQYLKFIFINKI